MIRKVHLFCRTFVRPARNEFMRGERRAEGMGSALNPSTAVIPAKAGIQGQNRSWQMGLWAPAFAGVTIKRNYVPKANYSAFVEKQSHETKKTKKCGDELFRSLNRIHSCHPERSEGSHFSGTGFFGLWPQNDKIVGKRTEGPQNAQQKQDAKNRKK
jgi:hypothetical protein